jgi:hypothetical protein
MCLRGRQLEAQAVKLGISICCTRNGKGNEEHIDLALLEWLHLLIT